ncbi:hypothetical protein [Solicola gregarius]|uniref:Uncharacterized protein n=1 Tax=Solicola gregarius TaxID=2908642 RepID=A0AA46THP1_9ACTN|nr:hypothetical protein [Solicola gregarius]UYM05012.1 hypothetical protein L0C25_21210 [Solicola gregarius]
MAGRAQNIHERLEDAPLGVGLTTITATSLAVTVLAFVGLPLGAAVVVVIVAAVLLVTGLVVHFSTRAAQRERNDRHRAWLSTLPPNELPDFRAEVADREDSVAASRQDWLRPLGAALTIMVSAVVVPYELIGSHSPDPLVEPINTVWIALTLVLGLLCLATSIIAAARNDERDDPPREPAPLPVGGRDTTTMRAAAPASEPTRKAA